MSKDEEEYVEKELVIYHYGNQGGLRYYAKNIKDFRKEFGDKGIIECDINANNQKSFYAFLNEVSPKNENIDENEWIKSKYSSLSHNCQDFVVQALEKLNPIYSLKGVFPSKVFINEIPPKDRTKFIPPKIKEVLEKFKKK